MDIVLNGKNPIFNETFKQKRMPIPSVKNSSFRYSQTKD